MKRSQIKKRPMSDTTLAKLEPEATEYREHDGHGLYLRVKPSGVKSWNLRIKKPNGKWGWTTLGKYPDLSAKEAREMAHTFEDKPPEDTFSVAAEDWYDHKVASGNAPDSLDQKRRYLDKEILPAIGHKPLSEVTRQDCANIQSSLEKRDALSVASKVRSWLNQIFSRAIARGRCEMNPASELRAVALKRQEQQYPHLLESELPDFLRALRISRAFLLGRVATWMTLRTASRPGMVRWAEWCEINLDDGLWTVPAAKMKMRREHYVPLSSQTITDLRELRERTGRSQYLFPGSRDNPVISEGTINKVISSAGYKGKLVGHGSRHTASTLLHEHGWPHDHVEAQLAHKVQGVAGVYNKAAYLAQRRTMIQWYADYLDALERGITKDEVETFKARVEA
ncbi:tyrosine-type recombinase/integrase [Halomonas sp. I1]|uniref:tyrosine-type recombinase/integrase n=1 Tax=Halomonas sp. I1 TaxID=393536 RepID=UPI0028E04B07|nr:tyrosine-type recombinase/integrase [Halomonas sp. I1]MDT8895614.1 tyrosine-type recombinase/integrase [Halomonas sp. I1]